MYANFYATKYEKFYFISYILYLIKDSILFNIYSNFNALYYSNQQLID